MERICKHFSSIKQITWRRLTLAIYITPFVLLFLIFNIIMDLSAETPAAVLSNSEICASAGRDALKDGGTAVDAAIVTLLCEGVALPHNAGIGGGFAASLYIRGKFDSIVATPKIPSSIEKLKNSSSTYEKGPRTIGVPGELMGYWEMHKKYGILPWKRLFDPAIRLCKDGVPISQYFAKVLLYNSPRLWMSPTMVNKFPRMNKYKEGEKIQYPELAKTLSLIASNGVSIFYKGELGNIFIQDVNKVGGLITRKDLSTYKVKWDESPPSIRLRGNQLATTPLPTSGPLLIFVLNIIKPLDYHYNIPLLYHKTIEALKFAFGLSGRLGDAENDIEYEPYIMKAYRKILDFDFAKHVRSLIRENLTFNDAEHYGAHQVIDFEKGSSNICIKGTKGDAVVVTTSITYPFGAAFVSPRTGIIPNNILTRYLQKDTKDKIAPPNRPLPGKRTFTAHCPVIVVHKNKATPLFLVGATGGPKAISLTVNAITRYIMFEDSAYDAVTSDHPHNQLFPNMVEFKDNLNAKMTAFLKDKGHEIVHKAVMYDNFSSISCIGNRFHTPELQLNLRVGETSEIFYPEHGFEQNFLITMGAMVIFLIGILFYEVHIPIDRLVIPKSHVDV